MITLKPCNKSDAQRKECQYCTRQQVTNGIQYSCTNWKEKSWRTLPNEDFKHCITYACEEKGEDTARLIAEKKELSQKIAHMECSTFEQERVIAGLKKGCNKKNEVIRIFVKERDEAIVRATEAEKRIQELEEEVKILKGNLDLAGFTISSQASLLRKGYGLKKPVKNKCDTCYHYNTPTNCEPCRTCKHYDRWTA